MRRVVDSGRGVVVGLSGGVDSAVAALRLVEAGRRVVGVTLRTCRESEAEEAAAAAARSTADKLGIEHRVIEGSGLFARTVLAEGLRVAGHGGTPSVCPVCNARVKLALLAEVADELGGWALATGHYARVEFVEGEARLLRGRVGERDQSYFLAALPGRLLERLVLPLGDEDKAAVRSAALRAGLEVARRPASMDLCPALAGPLVEALRREAPRLLQAGPIRDRRGRELGTHRGLFHYTLGQRRGLGLGGGSGEPLYVTGKLLAENVLVVGPEESLWSRGLVVEPVEAGPPPGGRLWCQPRRNHPGAPIEPLGESEGLWRTRFLAPQRALTPGQFAVFYRRGAAGDEVVGAGTIHAVDAGLD